MGAVVQSRAIDLMYSFLLRYRRPARYVAWLIMLKGTQQSFLVLSPFIPIRASIGRRLVVLRRLVYHLDVIQVVVVNMHWRLDALVHFVRVRRMDRVVGQALAASMGWVASR